MESFKALKPSANVETLYAMTDVHKSNIVTNKVGCKAYYFTGLSRVNGTWFFKGDFTLLQTERGSEIRIIFDFPDQEREYERLSPEHITAFTEYFGLQGKVDIILGRVLIVTIY